MCDNNHNQESILTFSEHEELPRGKNGKKYISCNVKYGDIKKPKCKEKAYQTIEIVEFSI